MDAAVWGWGVARDHEISRTYFSRPDPVMLLIGSSWSANQLRNVTFCLERQILGARRGSRSFPRSVSSNYAKIPLFTPFVQG